LLRRRRGGGARKQKKQPPLLRRAAHPLTPSAPISPRTGGDGAGPSGSGAGPSSAGPSSAGPSGSGAAAAPAGAPTAVRASEVAAMQATLQWYREALARREEANAHSLGPQEMAALVAKVVRFMLFKNFEKPGAWCRQTRQNPPLGH